MKPRQHFETILVQTSVSGFFHCFHMKKIKYQYYHFMKPRQHFETILVPKSVPGFQCFHMEKIKETKHFKNSAPFRPFLRKSSQNSAADWVLTLTFLFGPFWDMRPKNRPVGNTGLVKAVAHFRLQLV